jgi:hypothetical protein
MPRHFLLFLFLFVSSHSFLQDANDVISIEFDNESLLQALKRLKKNSTERFAYSAQELRGHKVNGQFKNKSIPTILEIILPPDLSFTFSKGLILIYRAEDVSASNQDPGLFNFRLMGECRDFYTREVLPYATIRALSSEIAEQSNQDGEFQIEAFFSDTSSISISYVGYKERVVRPIDFENPKKIQVLLKPEATLINGALIESYESPPIVSRKEISNFTVDVLRANQLTNVGESDALSLVKSIPGFDLTTGNNEGLGTRGMSQSENLYYLDGYPVFNPNHFFGLFSSINALSVKNIRVLKTGYSPSFGGRSSAVFDITSYEGNDEKLGLKIQNGLLSSSARLDGPLLKKRLTFSLSGRKSHTQLLKSELYRDLFNSIYNSNVSFSGSSEVLDAFVSEVQPEVDFSDLQAKIHFSSKKDFSLTASGFFSQDVSSQNIVDSLEEINFSIVYDNQYEWVNYGGSLVFKHKFKEKIKAKHLVSFSDFKTRSASLETIIGLFNSSSFQLQSSYENEVSDVTFKSEWDYIYSDSLDFKVGIENNFNNFKLQESSFSVPIIRRGFGGMLTNYFARALVNKKRLSTKLGVRVISNSKYNELFWEPRLKFNYNINKGVSIKAGYGVHYQFLRKTRSLNFFRGATEEWQLSGENNETPYSRSEQLVLGLNVSLKKIKLDVEGFLASQSGSQENLSLIMSGSNQNGDEIVFGQRATSGVEISSQVNVRRNKLSASYALYDSKSTLTQNSEELNFRNGQVSKHNMSLLWLWENNNLNISSNSVWASGKPYTPVVGSYVLELVNGDSQPFLLFGENNSASLPSFFRTDLSVGYKLNLFNSIKATISGSVQNVFNNQNIRFYSYHINETSQGDNFLILERETRHLGRLYSIFITLSI